MVETTKASRSNVRTVIVLLAALTAGLFAALTSQPQADAAFPGQNGRIAYQKNGDVWTMRSDGANRVRLTSSNNFEGNPASSPDGSRIAYENGRSIWVMNANGTGKKALTNGKSFDYDPAWSPNGKRIAFRRNFDIWTMSANGGSLVRLTKTSDYQESEPAWSPNGKRIAYTRSGCDGSTGGLCVFDMNANGSGQRNLTPEESLPGCENTPSKRHLGNSSEPNYSPNGTRIVFSGTTDCGNTLGKDIWTMDADGLGKVNLNGDNGTNDYTPAFSPNGAKIVFQSEGRNGVEDIAVYTMSSTGAEISRAVVTSNDDSDPDWGVKG